MGDIPEEYYGGRWTKHRHVTYATIHQLGHQRAGLTHLCLPDTTMNPAHSDSSCVMGQGEFAICTDFDLCWDPQFCENCRNALTNVSW